MGHLILFEHYRRTARQSFAGSRPTSEAGAQIVFFTGVRYMRSPNDPPVSRTPEPDNQGAGPSHSPRGRRKRA